MVHKKIPDFITTEISLWSGKLVLNNLLSLNIAFWFVRKSLMQVGLWNWKYVSSFIRGDKSNICIKFCKWEFSTDIKIVKNKYVFILGWLFANNCTDCFLNCAFGKVKSNFDSVIRKISKSLDNLCYHFKFISDRINIQMSNDKIFIIFFLLQFDRCLVG